MTDAEPYAVDIFFAKWLSKVDIEECKAMIEEAKHMHDVPMRSRRCRDLAKATFAIQAQM